MVSGKYQNLNKKKKKDEKEFSWPQRRTVWVTKLKQSWMAFDAQKPSGRGHPYFLAYALQHVKVMLSNMES